MNKGLLGVNVGILRPAWVQDRIKRLAPKLLENKVLRTTEMVARDRRIIKENL